LLEAAGRAPQAGEAPGQQAAVQVAPELGVELVLNAGLLNLVAFSRYGGGLDGQVFALFGIVLAAAEAVVALAIVLQVFRAQRSVDAAKASQLKE